MKKTILATLLLLSVMANAQTKKVKTVQTSTPSMVAMDSTYSSSSNELTALLGFISGAANLGVDYARMTDDVGFGGYFNLQTEKKSVGINQAMSLGGLMKFAVVNNNKFSAALSPGFGIHIVKDVLGSDETAFGPVLKISAQYKISSLFSLGLEQSTYANFFNDKLVSQIQNLAVAGTFKF
jgi:hypothetical protein